TCALPILWAIAAPASQALITRQVEVDMQGRIQGALMSLVSVAGIIAPIAFASVFGLFIGERAPVEFAGAPWMLAAILLGTAALIARRYAPRARADGAFAEPGGTCAGPQSRREAARPADAAAGGCQPQAMRSITPASSVWMLSRSSRKSMVAASLGPSTRTLVAPLSAVAWAVIVSVACWPTSACRVSALQTAAGSAASAAGLV